jgi:drug/metabolite transporter (DMT)-like permease
MATASPSAITVIAETALALYPILLKNIPTNLTTQVTARTATYAVLAYILASASDVSRAFPGSLAGITHTILYSVLNLVHIGVSYASYKLLPAGNALALFYTYPFWNMLLGWLFLGDSVSLRSIILLIVAFVGTYMVAKNSTIEEFKEKAGTQAGGESETANQSSKNTALGVALALGSAITESLIFLVVKTPSSPSPFLSMLQLYPLAAAAIAGYGFWNNSYSSSTIENTFTNTWLPLILFNACIGFVGYALRFYAIPKLSTAVFSILSVVGVIAAYVFQLMFTPEKINGIAALGSLLIAGAAGLAQA